MSNGNETAKGMGRRRGPMGGRGMTPGEKPKDLKGAIGKLTSYIPVSYTHLTLPTT